MAAASTLDNGNAPKPSRSLQLSSETHSSGMISIVFGLLTVIVSHLFFPAHSQYASLLLATATFGVGFFMRPVGGILLGVYADRYGRKAALLLIIVLMTVAIAMIGFAPTYAAIGIAAPILIVTARLLQGFATGGEFAIATAFLIKAHHRTAAGFTAPGRWRGRAWRV